MGRWRDEWETAGYRADLGSGVDFIRVRIQVERGEVIRYTAQQEADVGDQTLAMLRYDSAHGRPHRDLLDWCGAVIEKRWVPASTMSAALTEAIVDIRANWPTYRDDFERRRR